MTRHLDLSARTLTDLFFKFGDKKRYQLTGLKELLRKTTKEMRFEELWQLERNNAAFYSKQFPM